VFFAVGAMLAAGIGVGLGAIRRGRGHSAMRATRLYGRGRTPACRARS